MAQTWCPPARRLHQAPRRPARWPARRPAAAASGGAKRRKSKLVGRHLGGSGRYDKGLGPHAHLVAAQGLFGRLVGKGPPAGGSVPAPAVVGGLIGSDGRLGGGPHAQSPSGVGDPGKNGALVFMASAASRGARKPIEVVFLGQRRRPRERRRSARSRRDAAEKRTRASPELDARSGRE